MYNIFNMGVGLVMAVAPDDLEATIASLRASGENPVVIGQLEPGAKGVRIETR